MVFYRGRNFILLIPPTVVLFSFYWITIESNTIAFFLIQFAHDSHVSNPLPQIQRCLVRTSNVCWPPSPPSISTIWESATWTGIPLLCDFAWVVLAITLAHFCIFVQNKNYGSNPSQYLDKSGRASATRHWAFRAHNFRANLPNLLFKIHKEHWKPLRFGRACSTSWTPQFWGYGYGIK